MLKFRQLQAFHAVIRSGTVTGAAGMLGISQPGVSNLLTQLEHQTHLTLFRRTNGRLLPTPEGRILFDEVDTVVRSLDQVHQVVVDLQNQRGGQLQVVATHALSQGFLPKLIAQFVADQPETQITFETRYSRKIQDWVRAGLFEIGICELPISEQALQQETMRFECRLAIPKHSVLATESVITPAELDDYPLISLGEDHPTFHLTQQAFLQARKKLRIRCQAHLFRTALDFVKQGMGAALIDPFTLLHDDGDDYVVAPFKPSVHLELAIIRASDRPLSQLAVGFVDRLRSAMAAQQT